MRAQHARSAVTAAAILLLAACIRTTTVAWVAEPDVQRLSLVEGQRLLAHFVAADCERLVREGLAERVGRVEVDLDNRGDVLEARLSRPIGDEQIDGVIGAVVARLTLGVPPGERRSPERAELRAGYRCGGAEPYVVLQQL